MGSLMSGWDSPTSSSRRDLKKSTSLTKEEIENFWKVKKRAQEDHMKAVAEAIHNVSRDDTMISTIESSTEKPRQLQVSRSFGGRDKADVQFTEDVGILPKTKPGWWTRSNWAFLNEPPSREMEGQAYKYAAQHHVVARKPDVSESGVATAF